MAPNKNIKNKVKISNDSESDSDNNSLETSSKMVVNKTKQPKIQAKVETLEDDSEEAVDDVSDEDSSSDSDEDDNQDKKLKDKKLKESFDELTKRLDILQISIKAVDKDISEIEKSLKNKEKERNDLERQRNAILKVLSKTHNDEVTKARKEKPKRKGNVNGGFCKEQPVPEILIKFLGLKDGETSLKRPQVMSKLSNKFSEMGLKKGQDTTLNKDVVKELNLDKSYVDKVIKFGGFQTFLAEFYHSKEEKNTVNVC
jgi:hypothetical protein